MADTRFRDLERRLFDPHARFDREEIEAYRLSVLVNLAEEVGKPHELWLCTPSPDRIELKVGELLVAEGGDLGTALIFVLRPGMSRGVIEFVLSYTAGYRELIY